ncbi:ATP-binding protein [Halomicroarcula sp. GCM10025817]|uniref:ATP-binding protein n=1 Tax=Haloarcula TaxID=2237 RepID=UPI0023E8C7E6|nr:ATP-binding protein [Halomicroarcula sp. SYNS111]
MRAETHQDVAEMIVRAARDILDIPVNSVHLRAAKDDRLEPVAWTDEAREVVGPLPTFEPGSGLAWQVFESGDAAMFEDVSTADDRFNPETNVRSEMILPLGDYGVLLAGSTAVSKFDGADVSLMKTLTTTATAALEQIERTEALGLERHRLRTLFEMVPEPIIRVKFEDDRPVLRDGNPAFEETFGHDVEDAAGEPVNDLIVPPDRQRAAERIDDRIRSDRTLGREVRRQTDDGLGDFLFRSVPVPGERDEYFGIYVDISELKRYERRLEEQNERLEMFAGAVSHDLRNPLMVAQSGVEMVQQQLEGDGDLNDDALDIVARAHDRMDQLVDDLLTLARHNGQTLDPEPISLADVGRACWETVKTDGATLDVEATMRVRADESQLKQLLENLVRNAVDHGGTDVTVTIGDIADGFYVEDDGTGIPPAEREQVFERGYSTADDGTGFGLVIADQVADAHGWDLRLTDGADGGARFEVSGVETDPTEG